MRYPRSAYVGRLRRRPPDRRPLPARAWRRVAGLARAIPGVDEQVLPFYVRTTARLRRALRRAAAAAGVSDHALVERALRAFLRAEGGG